MRLRTLACALFLATLGVGVHAQTVELSSRTFWLGQHPDTMDLDPPFFALRRIGWLEDIVETDPILRATVIHVELSLRSASDSVSEVNDEHIELGPDRLPAQFHLPNYRIVGSPVPTSPLIDYFPEDEHAGYKVGCSIRDDRQSLSFCAIYATYPPDDGIRLKARLYFPDNPADRPDYFRQVVDRMRGLVSCIDVTDRVPERPVNNEANLECDVERLS